MRAPGLPRDVPRAVGAGRARRARPARPRRAQGRPRRHLGAEPLRVGGHPVRHRAHRRDPRQHQPGLQGSRAGVRAGASPASACWCWRAASARPTTSRCSTRSARSVRELRESGRARATTGRTFLADGSEVAEADLEASARRRFRSRRSDQHPVHLGHDRRPEGRHALAPQHPQQRLLHGADRCATPRTTGCACRCRSTTASAWCSATWPASPTAPAWWCPGESSTRRRTLRAVEEERCTSLYGVPTMFIAELEHPRIERASTSRSLRTGIMAGAPCPVEVMKPGPLADAHGRDHDRAAA